MGEQQPRGEVHHLRGRKQRPLNIQGRRSTLRLDTSLWKGPCAMVQPSISQHRSLKVSEDALLLFRGRDDSEGKVLSKGVVRRRKTSMTDYRLEQVADYLYTIELALVKYEAKENGGTYNKLFGGIGSFKRNWLKQARSKRI